MPLIEQVVLFNPLSVKVVSPCDQFELLTPFVFGLDLELFNASLRCLTQSEILLDLFHTWRQLYFYPFNIKTLSLNLINLFINKIVHSLLEHLEDGFENRQDRFLLLSIFFILKFLALNNALLILHE